MVPLLQPKSWIWVKNNLSQVLNVVLNEESVDFLLEYFNYLLFLGS